MKLKMSMLSMAISALCVMQQAAAANPASTQYVQQYVQDYVQNLLSTTTLVTRIGGRVPGGVVFFTDSTRAHGMIVANIDSHYGNSPLFTYPYLCGAAPTQYLFTTTGLRGGYNNTAAMIAYSITHQCQNAATQAAQFSVNINNLSTECNNSTSTDCLAGWTLPTAADLTLLMANFNVVNTSLTQNGGQALSGTYWSSSQDPADQTKAYMIEATQGATPTLASYSSLYSVRLVRYF